MDIYAFICTRNETLSYTTHELLCYLEAAKVKPLLLVNQQSIFEGYSKALEKKDPDENDIIILCHDDIKILSNKQDFVRELINTIDEKYTGFVGVAGTTKLSSTGVWWDHSLWKEGYHRGTVFHGNDLWTADLTHYGKPGPVVVLDGLFLAAKAKVLKHINLKKPEYLEGNWEFYDLHYTITATMTGYVNKVVPIFVMHNSKGEIVNRPMWHKNRELFVKELSRKGFPLPIEIEKP